MAIDKDPNFFKMLVDDLGLKPCYILYSIFLRWKWKSSIDEIEDFIYYFSVEKVAIIWGIEMNQYKWCYH